MGWKKIVWKIDDWVGRDEGRNKCMRVDSCGVLSYEFYGYT